MSGAIAFSTLQHAKPTLSNPSQHCLYVFVVGNQVCCRLNPSLLFLRFITVISPFSQSYYDSVAKDSLSLTLYFRISPSPSSSSLFFDPVYWSSRGRGWCQLGRWCCFARLCNSFSHLRPLYFHTWHSKKQTVTSLSSGGVEFAVQPSFTKEVAICSFSWEVDHSVS